jgi:SNF2 family DNA or RNA helicase
VVQIVCCNLSKLQADLYNTICQSKDVKALLKSGVGGGCTVLSSITALKKLCNHPKVSQKKDKKNAGIKSCSILNITLDSLYM